MFTHIIIYRFLHERLLMLVALAETTCQSSGSTICATTDTWKLSKMTEKQKITPAALGTNHVLED